MMNIPMLLTVVLIVILPLATGQSSCPLPTVDDIERELAVLLLNADTGGGPYDPTVSSHQYTCLAQGSTRDTYRRVSIIATFTSKSGQSEQTQHFQLDCPSGTWIAETNHGFNTPPSNPMERSDCFNCLPESVAPSIIDENHCLSCNSACNYGSGRCLSNSPVICCPYFGPDNMCTTSCPTNYVASANTNFVCECNYTCGPDEVANATCNGCNLADICLQDKPCQNGGLCVLLSFPDNYTCNCSGTGYMGTNCTETTIQPSPSPRPTITPPGSCLALNLEYPGYCKWSLTPVCSNKECYCDKYCHKWNDCCSDIADISCYPRRNSTDILNTTMKPSTTPTIAPPGSCLALNISYPGYCKWSLTPVCSNKKCYCDKYCHKWNDCCSDIAYNRCYPIPYFSPKPTPTNMA